MEDDLCISFFVCLKFKAFVYKFSEDLALEYAPHGVTVQCVLPGFVATNMSRIKRPTLRAPLPKDFVRGQMKTLGLEFASAGYWVHKLQVMYFKFRFGGYVVLMTQFFFLSLWVS